MTSDGHIVADFVDTGKLTAGVIKAGVLSDYAGVFSLNMVDGTLVMNGGTFKGALSAATGTFAGSLSAATGSFKGSLDAATGTITDGKGTLSLASGDLYMRNSESGGPGLFAVKDGTQYYSCWGSVNSAARNNSGQYLEVATYDLIRTAYMLKDQLSTLQQLANYWNDHGGW